MPDLDMRGEGGKPLRYTVVYEGDPAGNRILNGEPAAGKAVGVMIGDVLDMYDAAGKRADAAFARAATAEAEVVRLKDRIDALEDALKPFADWSERLDREFADHGDDIVAGGLPGASVTFGNLRAARAALTGGDHARD